MKCPKCRDKIDKIAREMYGHCYKCEDKKRKSQNISSKKFADPENLKKLEFFMNILGKGLKNWKKRTG